jgi:hypothetical protein
MSGEIESADVIRERIAQQMERQAAAAAALRTGGAFITFKNANLKVDGQPVPNNTADVRVLAVVSERAWYDGPFDPDQAQVPACYALDAVEPHEQARDPQASVCAECPKNKWGSAPPRPGSNVPGRGKACREGARLIVIPAAAPLATAPMYTAKIPVTSLSAVQTYMSRCLTAGRLSGEFVAQLSVTEDKKTFFKVHLNMKEHSPDLDQITLLKRTNEAMELAMQPYPDLENAD